MEPLVGKHANTGITRRALSTSAHKNSYLSMSVKSAERTTDRRGQTVGLSREVGQPTMLIQCRVGLLCHGGWQRGQNARGLICPGRAWGRLDGHGEVLVRFRMQPSRTGH